MPPQAAHENRLDHNKESIVFVKPFFVATQKVVLLDVKACKPTVLVIHKPDRKYMLVMC